MQNAMQTSVSFQWSQAPTPWSCRLVMLNDYYFVLAQNEKTDLELVAECILHLSFFL